MSTFNQSITATNNACFWLYDEDPGVQGSNKFYVQHGYTGTGNYEYGYASGLRFTSLPITKGAIITSATLSIWIKLQSGSPVTLCFGDDADNSALISSAYDGSTRVRTTANVDPGTYVVTETKNINVKGIVEEIIARTGWAAGNAMQFLIYSTGGVAGDYVQNDVPTTNDYLALAIEYQNPTKGRTNIMIF